MGPTELLRRFVIARRHRLGLTQYALKELSGLSGGWIGGLEAGRNNGRPKPSSLHKLAYALAMAPEDPAAMVNFLQLLLAEAIATEEAMEVAEGSKDCMTALLEATRVIGAANDPDSDRKKRMARALELLRFDLSSRDYRIAALTIGALYDSG